MFPAKIITRQIRWDLAAVALGGLAVQLAFMTPSAYFLHFDTAAQNVAALEWLRGCWGDSTLKILPVVLLRLGYLIFGPAHQIETALLLLAAAVTVAVAYELARLASGRIGIGILAALLLTALPAFQYFSRTHLGYPMPFLLLAWLAVWHKRWNWAGLLLGLAVAAHYNSWVPAGLFFATVAVFCLRPNEWRAWIKLLICFAIPLLAMDGLYFVFNGVMFQWDSYVFREVFRLSGVPAGPAHPNWLWVWQTLAASNGPFLAAILAAGLLAPFTLWRQKATLAMTLAFAGLACIYSLQGGIGKALLVSRILASSYPFWAFGAALICHWLFQRLPSPRWGQIATVVLGAALAVPVLGTGLFIRNFTQTIYPAVEAAAAQAAREKRPLRYQGNYWVGSYYGQLNGIETLADDDSWIQADAPGQAVLMFEGASPAGLNQQNYSIQVFNVSDQADTMYPGLTEEATLVRRLEVWWPARASAAIGRPAVLPDYSVYFDGSGCVTPPKFGDHSLHYYQLVWRKLLQALHLN